jgi:hypothetical protein
MAHENAANDAVRMLDLAQKDAHTIGELQPHKNRVIAILGNGADESRWPPGKHWLEAFIDLFEQADAAAQSAQYNSPKAEEWQIKAETSEACFQELLAIDSESQTKLIEARAKLEAAEALADELVAALQAILDGEVPCLFEPGKHPYMGPKDHDCHWSCEETFIVKVLAKWATLPQEWPSFVVARAYIDRSGEGFHLYDLCEVGQERGREPICRFGTFHRSYAHWVADAINEKMAREGLL